MIRATVALPISTSRAALPDARFGRDSRPHSSLPFRREFCRPKAFPLLVLLSRAPAMPAGRFSHAQSP